MATPPRKSTLTVAYHRLYYQLTTDHRDPTILTEEGYTKVQKPSGGSVRTNTAVHILSDTIKIVGQNECARVSIAGEIFWVPLKYIMTPGTVSGRFVRDQTRHEKEVAAGIFAHIEQYGDDTGTINLIIGKGNNSVEAKNIAWATQPPSKQHSDKADLILYTKDNWGRKSIEGRGNIFLSLKDIGGPERIRQYSGISELGAGFAIAHHPEVLKFQNSIFKIWEKEIEKKGVSSFPYILWAPIKSDELKLLAVCGSDTRPGKWGLNAIHFFCQGAATILTEGKENNLQHTLTFSEHTIKRASLISWFTAHAAYQPVLAIVPQIGRDARVHGVSISGCRLGIWPYGKVRLGIQLEKFKLREKK